MCDDTWRLSPDYSEEILVCIQLLFVDYDRPIRSDYSCLVLHGESKVCGLCILDRLDIFSCCLKPLFSTGFEKTGLLFSTFLSTGDYSSMDSGTFKICLANGFIWSSTGADGVPCCHAAICVACKVSF